jgi:peptidoglycan hydrolase-like protein with peptidoglycan-binding domain
MATATSILPIKEGSKGDAVVRIQGFLTVLKLYTGKADGSFGAKTKESVIKFQTASNLTKDGIVGEKTAIPLSNQAWAAQRPTIKEGSKGEAVESFQNLYSAYLGTINVDGVFGAKTKAEVIKFQKSRGLTADGVVGAKTWLELYSYSTHDVPIDQIISSIFAEQLGC